MESSLNYSEENPILPEDNPDLERKDDQRKRYRWGTNIELPIFLVMFGVSLSSAPITNLVMYRTCVHALAYPVAECRAFLKPGRVNITQETEEAVQAYSAFVSMVKSVLESVLPALLCLFMVVWSDRHGRKPLIVWPLLGITMTSMMVVVYALLDFLGPWWYIATCVPYSLSGGFSIMATASICFVTDLTTEDNRSLRIIIIQATFAAGMASGALASPYLFDLVGNVYLLLIAAAIATFAYAYTVVFVEESVENPGPGNLSTIFDISLFKDMFKECFKRRPNRLRAQILLLTGANSLSSFTSYGILGVGYLYTRNVLHWGLRDFTQFSAVSTAITFAGSLIGVGVIQRLFKIGDLSFSMVAFLSSAVGFYIQGVAELSWHMYLASAVMLFGDLPSGLLRSFVTKIIPSDDVAKVFALMCAVEGLCPVLAPVVFNALYALTLTTLPGAIMLLTSDIYLICVTLLGIVAFFRWRSMSPHGTQYSMLENDVES